MNTKTVTAQNCSLFEIDAELEEAFDQLQEEREITGTISNESRERCVQLFAELGKKIDRIAAYLRTQQRKASIAAEEAQRLQQRRRSAEQRVDDVKQMLTYFMRCRGLKRLEGELNTIRLQTTRGLRCRSTTENCPRSSVCIPQAMINTQPNTQLVRDALPSRVILSTSARETARKAETVLASTNGSSENGDAGTLPLSLGTFGRPFNSVGLIGDIRG